MVFSLQLILYNIFVQLIVKCKNVCIIGHNSCSISIFWLAFIITLAVTETVHSFAQRIVKYETTKFFGTIFLKSISQVNVCQAGEYSLDGACFHLVWSFWALSHKHFSFHDSLVWGTTKAPLEMLQMIISICLSYMHKLHSCHFLKSVWYFRYQLNNTMGNACTFILVCYTNSDSFEP